MTDASDHADLVAAGNLLRCWARERGVEPGDELRIPLPAAGTEVVAPVTYRSATGWHLFGRAHFATGHPVDATTLAALLTADLSDDPAAIADLVGRVADSTRRIAAHHAYRQERPHGPPGTPAFLTAEQALLDGHPWHPTPKSRDGIGDIAARAYSPELRGSFALHWFAAAFDVVRYDSADGRPSSALFGHGPDGTALVPAHPWQARDLLDRPAVRSLLSDGRLRYLGPDGPAWYPTSSLRTVFRPDSPVMLKLSLGMRITNSRRENLREELLRGTEVCRLLDAGLADRIAAAHPAFRLLRDPGWLAVEPHETGLNLVVRENPFGRTDDVACVAGLTAPGAFGADSRLTAIVRRTAERTGRTTGDVAAEWFGRYLEVLVLPVLWLYGTYGLAVEAHQQNTLVALDGDGWPVGGWYRDNQGYYLSEKRAHEAYALLPGLGTQTDIVTADDVIHERLTYYLGVNNLLGVVGALGSAGLAREEDLLADARRALGPLADLAPPAALLLEAPTLRTKGNLLTRVHGLDELVGPVETQSVYVDVANPLAGA